VQRSCARPAMEIKSKSKRDTAPLRPSLAMTALLTTEHHGTKLAEPGSPVLATELYVVQRECPQNLGGNPRCWF
jgi:hypothetical protein